MSYCRWAVTAALLFACGASLASPTVIPVKIADDLGVPFIRVTLGTVKADLMLDTGGQIGITVPETLITPTTGVFLTGRQERRTDVTGKIFHVRQLIAPDVYLDTAKLGPVAGALHYDWGLRINDDDRMPAPESLKAGVIGLGALSSRNMLLDMAQQRLLLYERGGMERPDLSSWQHVPFVYDYEGIVITLHADGVPIRFSLDTGASTSILRDDAAIFTQRPSPCAGKQAEDTHCGIWRLTRPESHGMPLDDLDVLVVPMASVPFDGLIGMDFLGSHKVFIDFDTQTLHIQATPDTNASG